MLHVIIIICVCACEKLQFWKYKVIVKSIELKSLYEHVKKISCVDHAPDPCNVLTFPPLPVCISGVCCHEVCSDHTQKSAWLHFAVVRLHTGNKSNTLIAFIRKIVLYLYFQHILQYWTVKEKIYWYIFIYLFFIYSCLLIKCILFTKWQLSSLRGKPFIKII